jgi:hypothetical protein
LLLLLLRLWLPLLRLLLILPDPLLGFLPLALLARLRRLFVEELRQILKLRHDLHAAFLVAGVGERTRTADHLLDVVLALLIQLGLRQLLLDPVQPLRAVLLLRQCRRARGEDQRAAGEQRRT